MSKKRFFYGKYYKCIADDGYSFALIDSESNDGLAKQFITPDRSYQIEDVSQIKVTDNELIFDVSNDDITLKGSVKMSDFHPLKRSAMGPFKMLAGIMECSHDIYSMYHKLEGNIEINGINHSFKEAYGYIEGDKGVNFPDKYIWYNSVGKDYGVTLAIATIPIAFIHFTGLLGFVSYEGKEYYICTYTGGKRVKVSPEEIIVKKGKYQLRIVIEELGGHLLKAPQNGSMKRYIKENLATPTKVYLTYDGKEILTREDKISSLEYMFD